MQTASPAARPSSAAGSAELILIVDFGSQFTQLIARRVREAAVFCEIIPCGDLGPRLETGERPRGIILSGSPASVPGPGALPIPGNLFESGIPVLGLCYGQHLMVTHLGGRVEGGGKREFGAATLEITGNSPLFAGTFRKQGRQTVWMSHGDTIRELPAGFTVIARTGNSAFAAIACEDRRLYGLQFHPEVAHTPGGKYLFRNFARRICGCHGNWDMRAFRERSVRELAQTIGGGRVVCGLSGGVDSTVTAALLHEAIGDRLCCVLVDTGLLRTGEAADIERLFRRKLHFRLHIVRAGDRFLPALAGVRDPEQKRRIIGHIFIDLFLEAARDTGGADFLAQGTLYPDVVESVSAFGGPSATIKSHHNVGGLPERLGLPLVEPLRFLFKDEVRRLGRELSLPGAFLNRHPFPGPGLAIRIPGEVTADRVALLREIDAIYLEEIRRAGLYDRIWQAFAILLPVRSVGVMGDGRSYEYACALRAVSASDGMTASVFPFPPGFLERVATRIINDVRGVNRVLHDVTSKPPGTIEWE